MAEVVVMALPGYVGRHLGSAATRTPTTRGTDVLPSDCFARRKPMERAARSACRVLCSQRGARGPVRSVHDRWVGVADEFERHLREPLPRGRVDDAAHGIGRAGRRAVALT